MSTELLWCEDCGKSLQGDCKLHGPLIRVKDRVIPSRARLTLPHYLTLRLLEMRAGNHQVLGVFAKKPIQKRTQFGPYVGNLSLNASQCQDGKLVFQVLKDGKRYFLNAPDEEFGNWMMFVQPARNEKEQTLVAHQYQGEVFFTTVKNIDPHTELKFWYAAEYLKFMEISTVVIKEESDLCVSPPPLAIETLDEWQCSYCHIVFSGPLLLESHQCINKDRTPATSPLLPKLRPMKVKAKNKVKQNDFSFGDNLAGSISNSSAIKGTCSNPASGVAPSVKFAYKREPSPMLGRKGKDAQHLDTYPCHFCDKVFCTSEKLTFHTYSHTGERPCRCSHQGCTKAFISKYKLIRHMATHSTQQSHACSYCDKTFHRKDHLKNHLQTHDPNKMAFKCEECGKKYNTKLGYKRHLALHAATSGDLTCRVCTQEFENTVILLDHLKSHAGKPSVGIKEKKHKCDHCEHHFYTRKDVRRHMVVHTGCKDFLCQFCDQRFGRKDHLTRHTKKTHSQELLKGRLHNGDFQGLLDPMSSFRLKQDGSMLHSFPRQELVPNEIMSSLQARHTSPLFQSRHNMEPSHPVESAAFEQSMGPLDNCLATHPMSLHSVGSSPKHTLNKYEFSSTSFPSPTIKNPPIMLDVKDYNASLLEELPLPESRSPHKINNKVSMQASSESTVNASEYIMPKDEVAISETVAMSPLEISHILGLWQLPGGNMVSVDTSVPFESNTAHHIMTFPGHQPQDLPIPMGSVGLHQLPHFTQTFSSSSPALPHFHHAFK